MISNLAYIDPCDVSHQKWKKKCWSKIWSFISLKQRQCRSTRLLFWNRPAEKMSGSARLDAGGGGRTRERERRRGAGAGVGACARLSVNVGETGRGDGVKTRRERGERRTKESWEAVWDEGRMSERVASCGSLYDSTNLLLQYCNNGELLLISPRTPRNKMILDPVSLKCVWKCADGERPKTFSRRQKLARLSSSSSIWHH